MTKEYVIEYDEQITVWQRMRKTVQVPDNFDLKNNLKEAIEDCAVNSELVEHFYDTEEHFKYDFDGAKIDGNRIYEDKL